MSSTPTTHRGLFVFVAVLVATLLFPVGFFVWFAAVSSFASVFIVGRWDEASWWKPFGYYGTGALFILFAVFLLVIDIRVGLWAGRRVTEETNVGGR